MVELLLERGDDRTIETWVLMTQIYWMYVEELSEI